MDSPVEDDPMAELAESLRILLEGDIRLAQLVAGFSGRRRLFGGLEADERDGSCSRRHLTKSVSNCLTD